MKEGLNHWTPRTYEVVRTWVEDELPVYALEGYDLPVRNHEILKVEGVEKAPRKRVVGKQSETARLTSPLQRGPALAVPKRRRLVEKTTPAIAAPRWRLTQKTADAAPV